MSSDRYKTKDRYKTFVYNFQLPGMDYTFAYFSHIPVKFLIKNLPKDATPHVHSTIEYGDKMFFAYSICFSNGKTVFFYELVEDSSQSSDDYVFRIHYDSTRAICSFDLSKKIIFVNSTNDELGTQTKPPSFYTYEYDYCKVCLVIYKNNILLVWHEAGGQVIVKTLDFSTFFEFNSHHFTRANHNVYLTGGDCKITFYTDKSDSGIYYSADFHIMSFLKSNNVSVVLYKYVRMNQPSDLSNSSKFRIDPYYRRLFTLTMSCNVKIPAVFFRNQHYLQFETEQITNIQIASPVSADIASIEIKEQDYRNP